MYTLNLHIMSIFKMSLDKLIAFQSVNWYIKIGIFNTIGIGINGKIPLNGILMDTHLWWYHFVQ